MRASLSSALAFAVLIACESSSPQQSADGGSPSQGGQRFSLSIAFAGSGSGSVRSADPATTCSAPCIQSAAAGARISLEALPDAGSHFTGWSGACSGAARCDLVLNADTGVTATFDRDGGPPPPAPRHLLAVSRNGSGTVRSDPAGIDCGSTCAAAFDSGARVTLTATPDSGFQFSGWGGACSGPGACVVTMANDAQVWATFDAVQPPPPPPPPPPPTDDCAKLRPGDPGPAKARYSVPTPASQGEPICLPASVDGHGTLALREARGGDVTNSDLFFVNPSGQLLASYAGNNGELTEQLSGFEGYTWERIDPNSYTLGPMLHAYDTSGRDVAHRPLELGDVALVREDPLGGMVVERINHPSFVESYDEQLNLRWRVQVPDQGWYDMAVDRAGRTLVLLVGNMQTARNTVDGIWIDRSGNASALFRVAGPFSEFPSQVSLTPRVGSGLFIKNGAQWVGQIDSGSTAPMAPAPSWLQARADTLLHMVRGGTGYAVFPSGNSSCPQAVEVVAPSGASCGAATFAPQATSCRFTHVRVGYDGTVSLGFSEGGKTQCTWEWWPGFLG